MMVFEQVVAEHGFAAAARKLDIAPAAVTRLIADLEDHLGVRLLQRTTRRPALTPAGEAYLDRVRGILVELEDAEEVARSAALDANAHRARTRDPRRDGPLDSAQGRFAPTRIPFGRPPA